MPKARIRQNVWDNWYCYLGTRRVMAFGKDSQGTAEQHAQAWLAEQTGGGGGTGAVAVPVVRRDVPHDRGDV